MKRVCTFVLLLLVTACYHDNVVVNVKSGNSVVLNSGQVVVLTNVPDTQENYSYLMDNVIGTQIYMAINSQRTENFIEVIDAIVYNANNQCINEILGGSIKGINPSGIIETSKTHLTPSLPSIAEPVIENSYPSVEKTQVLTSTEIFKKCSPAVFKIYTSTDDKGFQGSGFFVASDGVAVSNYHVFEGTYLDNARIILDDKTVYTVTKIYKTDSNTDYIIFQVAITHPVPYINLSDSTPAIGEEIYTIGSPRNLDNTFSSGEISQIRDNGNLFQINAPIDHGSSGGVLLNNRGEAVGITTSGYDESGANLNFAINIKLISRYLP